MPEVFLQYVCTPYLLFCYPEHLKYFKYILQGEPLLHLFIHVRTLEVFTGVGAYPSSHLVMGEYGLDRGPVHHEALKGVHKTKNHTCTFQSGHLTLNCFIYLGRNQVL